MTAPTTATPTPLRTRTVTVRVRDLPALAARGVWMSTAQRDAVHAIRIDVDPDAWESMALGRAGRVAALAHVIERRLEPILNPHRRSYGSSVRVEVDPDAAIPQPPARHGSAPGEPAQGRLFWGEFEVGVVYVREEGEPS